MWEWEWVVGDESRHLSSHKHQLLCFYSDNKRSSETKPGVSLDTSGSSIHLPEVTERVLPVLPLRISPDMLLLSRFFPPLFWTIFTAYRNKQTHLIQKNKIWIQQIRTNCFSNLWFGTQLGNRQFSNFETPIWPVRFFTASLWEIFSRDCVVARH